MINKSIIGILAVLIASIGFAAEPSTPISPKESTKKEVDVTKAMKVDQINETTMKSKAGETIIVTRIVVNDGAGVVTRISINGRIFILLDDAKGFRMAEL